MSPAEFVERNTAIAAPPLIPEIRLHLADRGHADLAGDREKLRGNALPPPFWAFAWAGGQALARYLLDHPETVAGREVLDIGFRFPASSRLPPPRPVLPASSPPRSTILPPPRSP